MNKQKAIAKKKNLKSKAVSKTDVGGDWEIRTHPDLARLTVDPEVAETSTCGTNERDDRDRGTTPRGIPALEEARGSSTYSEVCGGLGSAYAHAPVDKPGEPIAEGVDGGSSDSQRYQGANRGSDPSSQALRVDTQPDYGGADPFVPVHAATNADSEADDSGVNEMHGNFSQEQVLRAAASAAELGIDISELLFDPPTVQVDHRTPDGVEQAGSVDGDDLDTSSEDYDLVAIRDLIEMEDDGLKVTWPRRLCSASARNLVNGTGGRHAGKASQLGQPTGVIGNLSASQLAPGPQGYRQSQPRIRSSVGLGAA